MKILRMYSSQCTHGEYSMGDENHLGLTVNSTVSRLPMYSCSTVSKEACKMYNG